MIRSARDDWDDFERDRERREKEDRRLSWLLTFLFVAAAVMGVALAGALFTLVVFAIRWLAG